MGPEVGKGYFAADEGLKREGSEHIQAKTTAER